MTNDNSIAIANETLDNMFDAIREMDVMNDGTSKKLEEMIDKVKSFKDILDKKAKNKNERPISLKESKTTGMIPTTAIVKDAAPTVDKEYNDPYENDASDVDIDKLKKMELKYDDNGFLKPGTVLYGICIKDFESRKCGAPIFRDVIHMITDNMRHISKDHYAEAAKLKSLTIFNPLVYSGLYVYKIPTEGNAYDYIPFSDFRCNLQIPISKEDNLIKNKGTKLSFILNNVMYSDTEGYLVEFDDIKAILTDPDTIAVSASTGYTGSLYLWDALYRDSSNNNYIIDHR